MDEAPEQLRLTLHDDGCTEDENREAVRMYQTSASAKELFDWRIIS